MPRDARTTTADRVRAARVTGLPLEQARICVTGHDRVLLQFPRCKRPDSYGSRALVIATRGDPNMSNPDIYERKMVDGDRLLIAHSTNKEDIAVGIVDTTEI